MIANATASLHKDIDELNSSISTLLKEYNNKIIKRINKSRYELFKELDEPALKPLNTKKYIYREFKKLTVGIDYHIELNSNGYSVPYTYKGKKVDVWYSKTTVWIVYQGETIAIHSRLHHPYQDSTLKEHMPPSHQYQFEKWNPGRILNWAKNIGEETTALMKEIMKSRSHIVRSYKSCMAILNLSKTYGNEALELTCKKARKLNIKTVSSIESILKTKSYLETQDYTVANNTLFNQHENIRGSASYQ